MNYSGLKFVCNAQIRIEVKIISQGSSFIVLNFYGQIKNKVNLR